MTGGIWRSCTCLNTRANSHTEYDLEIWLYDLEQPLHRLDLWSLAYLAARSSNSVPDDKLLAIGNYHQLQVFDVASSGAVAEIDQLRIGNTRGLSLGLFQSRQRIHHGLH